MTALIQKPILRNIILTTICCSIAGILSQLFFSTLVMNLVVLIWFLPPIFFGNAILIAFRKTRPVSVIRGLLLILFMWLIYILILAISSRLDVVKSSQVSEKTMKIINQFFYCLPGILVIIVAGFLLRIKIPVLNILISGSLSWIAFILSFKIDIDMFYGPIFGPIFLFWQPMVGFSIGLINKSNNESIT